MIKALTAAGYTDLAALNGVDYAELIILPGVGPRTLERIQEQLVAEGMSLGGTVPVLPARGATIQPGHTGEVASDIKTHITAVDPVDFINSLDTPRRVEHGHLLLEIFNRVTGARPKMWGPTMIGYGDVHYTSHTGREGDEELLDKFGKHTRGAGCGIGGDGPGLLGVGRGLIKEKRRSTYGEGSASEDGMGVQVKRMF